MMQQQATPVTTTFSPGEWMRIFAIRLAQHQPSLPAEQVVGAAVDEFRASYNLPPEMAVRHCRALRSSAAGHD